MKATLLALVLGIAFACPSAQAGCNSPPLSSAQIKRAYETYTKILRASPQQRRFIFQKNKKLFKSEGQMLAMAKEYVKVPLQKRLSMEQAYAEWFRSACRPGSNPSERSGYICRCEANLLGDDGSNSGSGQVETRCPAGSVVQLSCDGEAYSSLSATCTNTFTGKRTSESRSFSSRLDSSSLRCGLW